MKTKLLFVCSMNHDRSPAAEAMFRNSNKYEAKSAGLDLAATKQISIDDVKWADIIFVMDERNDGHKTQLIDEFTELVESKDVRVLGIPNYYRRYDPELYRLLRVRIEKEGIDVEETNYEDFIEGYEEKKEFEILEGEKSFAEWNKLVKLTGASDNSSEKGGSFGMGATYMSSQLIREIFLKNLNKTPEEEAKEKKDEAKKKKIREENRRGWVK